MSLILIIRNVSELADISDYEYTAAVTTINTLTGEVGERVIERGDVKGHPRVDGWAALVQRLLDQRPE